MLPERRIRFAASLCYLPFASVVAALVALLKFPHSPFALYHVRQGFGLFIVWFLSLFVLAMTVWVGLLFWVVLVVVSFRASAFAWLGHEKPFPGLRSLSKLMPVEAIYRHLTGKDFPRRS